MSRDALQAKLESIPGVAKVYFQPPSNIRMVYPCIRYSRSSDDTKYADDRVYARKMRYQLIVIDRDPTSDIPGVVAELPYCEFVRSYTKDGLNHNVYDLYF